MTAHLRELRRALDAIPVHELPGVWPERIGTHITSISVNLETAITNLGAMAHSPPDADLAHVTTDDEKHQSGDRRASPTESGARLAIGPQRVIDTIDNDLTIGLAHLRIATGTHPHAVHDHCRHAWHRLGDARSAIEKHAAVTYTATLTCACGGMPGYLEWGDQLCHNIAAAGLAGLCIQCARKRKAWLARRDYREHGRRDRAPA